LILKKIQNDELRAIVYMLSSAFLFNLTWMGVKGLQNELPLFELIFFRSFISLLFLLPFTIKHSKTLKAKQGWLLFARSLFGLIGMGLNFFALPFLSLGDLTAVFNTLPIIMALLAPFLLKERFNPKRFWLIVISFIGVCLVVKPGHSHFSIASLMPLTAAFAVALSMIFIRKLNKQNTSYIIAFYFTLFASIFSLPFCIANFVMPNAEQWLLLLEIGLTVSIAQVLLTKAYICAEASFVAPFGYSSVLWAYLGGMMFWNEVPDLLTLAGVIFITSSGILIMRQSKREKLVPAGIPALKT